MCGDRPDQGIITTIPATGRAMQFNENAVGEQNSSKSGMSSRQRARETETHSIIPNVHS